MRPALLLTLLSACADRPPPGAAPAGVTVRLDGRGVLAPGEAVRPGDRLQVEVDPGPWREAWLGEPAHVHGSFPLAPDRATVSPFSLRVDASKGAETLVILLTERPLSPGTAARALNGPAPAGVTRLRFDYPKETP